MDIEVKVKHILNNIPDSQAVDVNTVHWCSSTLDVSINTYNLSSLTGAGILIHREKEQWMWSTERFRVDVGWSFI